MLIFVEKIDVRLELGGTGSEFEVNMKVNMKVTNNEDVRGSKHVYYSMDTSVITLTVSTLT